MSDAFRILVTVSVLSIIVGCSSTSTDDASYSTATPEPVVEGSSGNYKTPSYSPTMTMPASDFTNQGQGNPVVDISINLGQLREESNANVSLRECFGERLGSSIHELDGRQPSPEQLQLMIPCIQMHAPQLVQIPGADVSDLNTSTSSTNMSDSKESQVPVADVRSIDTDSSDIVVIQVPAKDVSTPGISTSDTNTSDSGPVIGTLIEVSNPTPKYISTVSKPCMLDEEAECVEIKWEPTGPLLAGGLTHIAISKSSPEEIYAGYDANDMSIWKSNDSGTSWRQSHANAHVSGLAVHPVKSNVAVYSVLENLVFRTEDGGETWDEALRLPGAFRDKSFTAVSFAQSEPYTIYAAASNVRDRGPITAPSDIMASSDLGITWSTIGQCSTCGVIHTVRVGRQSPRTIFIAGSGGIHSSTDGGETWVRLSVVPSIGLDLDPQNESILLAATRERGVFRSEDNGNSWVDSSTGLTNLGDLNTHRIAISETNPNVAYLTTHNGVFYSSDSGKTWHSRSNGLGYKFVHAIAIDPRNPDIAYVGTASELNTAHAEHMVDGIHYGENLYKTIDGGSNWLPSGSDIVESGIEQMAGHTSIAYTLWTAGAAGRGAFVSQDGGDSWAFAPFPGAHYPMVFEFSAWNPLDMYLTSWAQGGEISKSQDGGATWYSLKNQLLAGVNTDSVSRGLYKNAQGRTPSFIHLHGLAVAKSDPNIVYVGSVHDTRNPVEFNLTGIHLFRSDDGGLTWLEKSSGLPTDARTSINAIAVDPVNPDIAYAMTSSHESEESEGVYKTTDGGQSWYSANKGLRHVNTNDIQIDPISPDTLYLAMDLPGYVRGEDWFSGVYKSVDSAETWEPSSDGLPPGSVSDLALDPLNPNVLYAATREGVFMSVDGAQSWFGVNSGLPKFGRDASFSHDRILEIDSAGRVIYAAVKQGSGDSQSPKTIYRAVVKPEVKASYKFELTSVGVQEIFTVESSSNVWSVSYDKSKKLLEIGIAGPEGTSGYIEFIVPTMVQENLLFNSKDSIDVDSASCDNNLCMARYQHTGQGILSFDSDSNR